MSGADVLNLGISIGLGLLSIGLGGFSIWLSYKFSKDSATALDAVKDLARETRSLVEASLSQQKEFSQKMLDSILEQNKYGRTISDPDLSSSKAISDGIERTLGDFESKIIGSVEKTVQSLGIRDGEERAQMGKALAEIRTTIGSLREAAPVISSVVQLPRPLRDVINEYRDTPAHYALLAAILSKDLSSNQDVEKIAREFGVPEGWEGGTENLIRDGVLEEHGDGFRVPDTNRAALEAWLARNENPILALTRVYKKKEDVGVAPEELKIAKRFEN